MKKTVVMRIRCDVTVSADTVDCRYLEFQGTL